MLRTWRNGDGDVMGEIEARRQRDRMFQMGLFTCLIMVLLDAKTAPPSRPVPAPSDSSATKRPYQQLKKVLAAQTGDGHEYPTNVTGKFTGNWTRESYGDTNATSPAAPATEKFKLSSKQGRFAMQVFMDRLEGLEELSLVRGYFQLIGESDPMRHQLTSSVQGIFFHKYGRVTMVTSHDHLYLKGNKLPLQPGDFVKQNRSSGEARGPAQGNTTTAPLTPGADLAQSAAAVLLRGGHSASAHASTRRMLSSLRSASVHRRLSAAIQRHDPESALESPTWHAWLKPPWQWVQPTQQDNQEQPGGHRRTEASSADGPNDGRATEGSSALPNDLAIDSSPSSDDPHVFVFPVPGSSVPSSAASSDSSSGSRRCQFLFDLKAGPSCEVDSCPKSGPPHWVTSLDGRVVSDNCNVELRLSTTAFHIDWERVYPEATKYAVVVTAVCLLQIVCLFRQLHYTSTPALAARISLICIGQQSVLDAIVCVVHLLLCAFLPQLFAAFASIAFFKLIIFIIVEMRYIVVISHGRDPQRFFAGGANQLRQEFAVLHLRFYGVLFITLLVVYVLQAYFNVLVLIAYSYWVPQIVTNAIREVRQPFHRVYLFGMSATRLVIPLYVYGFPSNLVHIIAGEHFKSNYRMCFLLVLWTAIQVWVLLLQQKLGPQFMVPARFLPTKYDYKRPLPRALLDKAAEEGGRPECVICYQDMNVQPFASQDYMITPCDHIFHQQCLERWMLQKAECPVCRAALPPHDS